MALAKGRKLWSWIGATLALVLILGLTAGYLALRPYGVTGSTYIAKQLCSCVFVAGRSDGSCEGENKPDIDRFSIRIDHAARSVSARLLLFSSQAAYDDGYGCRIAR
jgi:hypothetical protein